MDSGAEEHAGLLSARRAGPSAPGPCLAPGVGIVKSKSPMFCGREVAGAAPSQLGRYVRSHGESENSLPPALPLVAGSLKQGPHKEPTENFIPIFFLVSSIKTDSTSQWRMIGRTYLPGSDFAVV